MPASMLEQIAAAHQLYCQLTGQNLRLGFDRERQWYEWLHAGFTPDDLRRVIRYLQREIRAGRRNVGALKLSNLLQLDRFEEDLNISKVRLRSAPSSDSSRSTPTDPPLPTPAQLQNLRQQDKAAFARCATNSAKLPTLNKQTLETKSPGTTPIPLNTSVVITVRKLPQI